MTKKMITTAEMFDLVGSASVMDYDVYTSNGVTIKTTTYSHGVIIEERSGFWQGSHWMETFVLSEATE